MPERPHSPDTARARFARLALVLAGLSLLALLAPGVGRDMEALYPRIDPTQPYLSLVDPLTVYLRLPLALLGSFVLVLAPGLLLALALDLGASLARWLLHGFLLSLIGLSAVSALAQGVLGRAPMGAAFTALALGTAALPAVWLVVRAPARRWPLEGSAARRELTALVVGSLVLALLLVPKLFWESFNGDGAHAFEASRLLLHGPLPFWPEGVGEVSAFPGLNSALFTFPNAWFLRLFGEHPSAVRLPFLLFLVVLYAALLAVIEHGAGRRRLGAGPRALIGMGLVGYGLVMAYSATYDPYCSDIGLPATQDTLVVITFLATVSAFQRERTGWTVLGCLLTLVCSPAGSLLLGAWFVALLLGWRERRWARLARYAGCLVAALVLAAAAPAALGALGLPAPGGEHGAGQLLEKFRYLQLGDLRRVLFLVVPAGVYPALGLCAWRRGDDTVRALIVVVVLVFATYYAVAFVGLHYFVPVMLLPLAIFWRQRRTSPAGVVGGPALSAGAQRGAFALALAAVVLGLPRTTAIYTAGREVGEGVELRGLASYADMHPDAFLAADLLKTLFTPGTDPAVPEAAYAGSPLVWHHYARRAAGGGGGRQLLLGRDGGPGPGEPHAANAAGSLHVLDRAAWAAQRVRRPVDCRGLGLYDVPRDVLFKKAYLDDPERFDRFRVLDVRSLLGRLLGGR